MENTPRPSSSATAWLREGGETGGLVRAKDWSATPLGPIEHWPVSLRVAIGMSLNSRFPMHVWWGPELIYIYNDAHIPILGKRHPAALGQRASDIWTEVWPLLAPQVEAVMQRGETVSIERGHVVIERNGFPEEAWFSWCYSPIYDESGAVVGLLCVSTEDTQRVLTERRRDELELQRQQHQAMEKARAEEALRDSTMLLRGISDSTGDVIFAKDLHGRMRFANPATLALIGKPIEQVLGRTDAEFLQDADAARMVMENDRRVMESGLATDVEEVVPLPDGTRRIWLSRKMPYLDADGKVIGVLGVSRDVTSRKNMEESLRLSQRRLSSLMAANIIGIHICDEHRVIEANDAYLAIIGYSRAELEAGQIVWRAITRIEDLALDDRSIEELAAHGACAPFEKQYIRKDGTPVPVLIGIASLEEGQARFICVVQDLTSQKEAERARIAFLEQERAARAEAERVSRMKDEFLATLSHELRTPLNAILGWSQILAGGARNDHDLAEGLETIERNARAQTTIIEDLLDMSRIISGKVRLDVQRVDLATVVRASVDTLKHAADAKGVRLQVVLDPLAGPVSGDPARLQQIFWNLLTNAVKFTPRGGRIQVLLERVNSHLEVSIIDSGQGIKPEFLPHVFERFRQADASTTRRHGGLGLGLAIVKQLVELHGGETRAKSPGEGKGATFTVTLPVTVVHAESVADIERRHPHAGAVPMPWDACADIAGVRVLVVDDEPDARALVKRLLENCNAVVTVAGSVDEAMERIQHERPDVIASDIGMPDADGYELIRRVRALGKENGGSIPAIALTAYARAEDRVKAVRAGFQHHVAKPVEPAELIAMIASLTKLPTGK